MTYLEIVGAVEEELTLEQLQDLEAIVSAKLRARRASGVRVSIAPPDWKAGHDDGLAGKRNSGESYSYSSGYVEGRAHRDGYRCACGYEGVKCS